MAREQALAERDALVLRHPVETCGTPRLLRRLDDERRGVAVVLVRVRLEPAPRRFLECERERVEALARAQPYEAALAYVDVGLERVGVARADAAVDAVGRDDHVGGILVRHRRVVGGFVGEAKLHT